MKKYVLYSAVLIVLISSCTSRQGKNKNGNQIKVTFEENNDEKKIDVLTDGNLFTSFRWTDNMTKPVFYPIFTAECSEVTRGFPLEPKAGERADHPHQIGMWFTYGNVNGLDFWGNGSQGLGTTNPNGGIIRHLKIENTREGTRRRFFYFGRKLAGFNRH